MGKHTEELSWAIFAAGVVAAATIVGGMKLHRFRTFVHELKHAVVVILTGNRIYDFRVDKHTGHVKYSLTHDTLRFAPLIAIAPYFLPLFSVPVLVACLIFDQTFSNWLCFILGFALTTDIILGFQEIHPHQTDIKNSFGGIILVGLFIVSIQIMWTSICLLWVTAGRDGFIFAGETSYEITKAIAEKKLFFLPVFNK